MKLTTEAVQDLMRECMFTEGEPTDNPITAQGVVLNVGFHRERLEAAKPKIKELLAELPEQFHQETGGGWSFLNACETKEGIQWGEHRDIDALLCLGIASQ